MANPLWPRRKVAPHIRKGGIRLADSPRRTRRRRRCEINDRFAPEVVGQIVVVKRAVAGAIAIGDFPAAELFGDGVFRLGFCGRIPGNAPDVLARGYPFVLRGSIVVISLGHVVHAWLWSGRAGVLNPPRPAADFKR